MLVKNQELCEHGDSDRWPGCPKESVCVTVARASAPALFSLSICGFGWHEKSGLQLEENYEHFLKSGCDLDSLVSTGRLWHQQIYCGKCWAVCGPTGRFLWEVTGQDQPLGLLSCTLSSFM